jgi:DNA-binding response OmpR family regulator
MPTEQSPEQTAERVEVDSRLPLRVLFVGASTDLEPTITALRQRAAHVSVARDLESFERAMSSAPEPTDGVVFDLRAGDHVLEALTWYCRNVSRLALILTSPNDVQARLHGLHLSVADHAVAPFAVSEIVARVEQLVARQRLMRRSRLDAGDFAIDIAQRSVLRSGASITLTPRELDVLLMLVRNRTRPVSKQALLDQVWLGSPRTPNVVEATVSSLRRKLHANGPPVIHTLHKIGYTFRPVLPTADGNRVHARAERERLVRERDEALARRDEVVRQMRKLVQDGADEHRARPPDARAG